MADKKINQYPLTSSVGAGDLILIGNPLTGTLSTVTGQALFNNTALNTLSSSYSQDSASFVSNINTLNTNQGKYLQTGSYLTDSGSFNSRIANVFASESNYLPTSSYLVDSSSFNSKIVTNTGNIANVFASESNYLPTASYLTDSSSFNSRISNISSSLTSQTGSYTTTGSFNAFTASVAGQIANVFASESNYLPTASFVPFSSSVSSQLGIQGSQINNTFASQSNYATTSSLQALSSSYSTDSGSFNSRIIALSGSLSSLTGSYVTTGSFNSYTGSANTQVLNVYASESNYLPTSSFLPFSSSYVRDSGSFLTLIASVSGSGGGVSVINFNSYTASTNAQIINIFASESNYTPTSSFNTFSSSYHTDSGSFNTRINSITGSGGGGTGSSFANQDILTGISATGSACPLIVTFNPTSSINTFGFMMPPSPGNNQEVIFQAGGSISSGYIISTFNLVPNTGQNIYDPSTPSYVIAGMVYRLRWSTSQNGWYKN